jgi:hypothetical protein
MRAVWIDAGQNPDYPRLGAAGADSVYFDIRDERLTPAYFGGVAAHGLEVGVYAAANWYGNVTGSRFADLVSGRLDDIARGTVPSFPMVCLDIEVHDPSYIIGALRRWREHRPQRVTDWTLEGHQGGILTAGQWLVAGQLVRFIVPQLYNGAMTQVWDGFAMAKDLNDHGLPFGSVRPFYDAAHLPVWWDGYAFTQGRLP